MQVTWELIPEKELKLLVKGLSDMKSSEHYVRIANIRLDSHICAGAVLAVKSGAMSCYCSMDSVQMYQEPVFSHDEILTYLNEHIPALAGEIAKNI